MTKYGWINDPIRVEHLCCLSLRESTTLWVQIVQVSIDILSRSINHISQVVSHVCSANPWFSAWRTVSLVHVLVYNSCMNDLNLNWNSIWSSTRLRIETLLLMGMDQDRQLANLHQDIGWVLTQFANWPTARHVRIASFSLDASRFFGIQDRAAPGAMLGISDTMFRVGTTVVRQNIIIYIVNYIVSKLSISRL